MAKSLNKVELIGYLGADPEMRYTQGGSAVASVNIATTRSFKRGDSADWEEETEWTPLVLWANTAETITKYAHKGSRVYVSGRLQTRSWDDKDTGAKRFKTEVVVDELILLDGKPAGSTDKPNAQPAERPQAAARQNTQPSRQPARNVPSKIDSDEDLPF
jgi:single-strand DNA-binding protein